MDQEIVRMISLAEEAVEKSEHGSINVNTFFYENKCSKEVESHVRDYFKQLGRDVHLVGESILIN